MTDSTSNPDSLIPKLESKDPALYKILSAHYTINYDFSNNHADYTLRVEIETKTSDTINWYTRFDDEAEARFLGAEFESPAIPTTHSLKKNGNGSLQEIALTIPAKQAADSFRFVVRYTRKASSLSITRVFFSERVMSGFFCSFASDCEKLSMEINLTTPYSRILNTLTPAKFEPSKNLTSVKISRALLAPKQFTPITILIEKGRLSLSHFASKSLWAFIGAIVSHLVTKLLP